MQSELQQYAYIKPSQLRVGLYVHLDMLWIAHPFSLSSFKIEQLDQVKDIQRLGLTQIRCNMNKSEGPLSPPLSDPQSIIKQKKSSGAKREQLSCFTKRELIASVNDFSETFREAKKIFLAAVEQCRALFEMMVQEPSKVPKALEQLIDSIADSILMDMQVASHILLCHNEKNAWAQHSVRVAILSMILARHMALSESSLKWIGAGALFHDVGYNELPVCIREKKEPLTIVEQEVMRQHCKRGVDICNKLGLPFEAILIVWQHHERFDGSGYPEGLRAGHMSPLAAIVALVDAYDELCHPPYHHASYTFHDAFASIYAYHSDQFDKKVLTALMHCVSIYPPKTVVLLSNGMYALVVLNDCRSNLSPIVLVRDVDIMDSSAILLDLAKEPSLRIMRAMHVKELSHETIHFFSEKWYELFGAQLDAHFNFT